MGCRGGALVPRPPRQATGATPGDATKVSVSQGTAVRKGRQRTREKEMAERQVVEQGAIWSLPARHCPARKDCWGLIHRPRHVRVGGKETVTEWSAPRSSAALIRVRFPLRTKACRGLASGWGCGF